MRVIEYSVQAEREDGQQADPARHIRRRWSVENTLHWVRDSTAFRKVNHKLSEGNAHVMVPLR